MPYKIVFQVNADIESNKVNDTTVNALQTFLDQHLTNVKKEVTFKYYEVEE